MTGKHLHRIIVNASHHEHWLRAQSRRRDPVILRQSLVEGTCVKILFKDQSLCCAHMVHFPKWSCVSNDQKLTYRKRRTRLLNARLWFLLNRKMNVVSLLSSFKVNMHLFSVMLWPLSTLKYFNPRPSFFRLDHYIKPNIFQMLCWIYTYFFLVLNQHSLIC